jgi:hypothetical protein
MDREIVYPGAMPLDTDILNIQRNAMISDGFLAQAMLGNGPVANGLVCAPTSPTSMQVTVGPGMLATLQTVDATAFGSLAADTTDALVKVGINLTATTLTLTAPTTSGDSINYLVEAAFTESDTGSTVLSYFDSANPSLAYSGPANSGAPQNTQRIQRVTLTLKGGSPAATGSQTTPATDSGNVGLYVITVPYAATTVTVGNIAVVPAAPFLQFSLSNLRPGFASGVQNYTSHGTYSFAIPATVTQIEVELWAGGSGSWASVSGCAGGGGSGGGYSRKRITGLTPGSLATIVVGQGGTAGVSGTTAPGAGGPSSFTIGSTTYLSATGGVVNPLGVVGTPSLGNLAGVGSGGDVNLYGGDGQSCMANQGGLVLNLGGFGGEGPLSGGVINSGTTGTPGRAPGGGASGAGSGSSGTTAYAGAAGADGQCIVRW